MQVVEGEGVYERKCVAHLQPKLPINGGSRVFGPRGRTRTTGDCMTRPLDTLLSALDLTDTGARTSEDIFTGHSQWTPLGRVFGGQVLAQSLVASMRTVTDDRPIHSMHGY